MNQEKSTREEVKFRVSSIVDIFSALAYIVMRDSQILRGPEIVDNPPRPTPRPGSTRGSHHTKLAWLDGREAYDKTLKMGGSKDEAAAAVTRNVERYIKDPFSVARVVNGVLGEDEKIRDLFTESVADVNPTSRLDEINRSAQPAEHVISPETRQRFVDIIMDPESSDELRRELDELTGIYTNLDDEKD